MKNGILFKVTVMVGVMFLMSSLPAAQGPWSAANFLDADLLEDLLQGINTANEEIVKAQLADLKNANKLYILNQYTKDYSPLGKVNDLIEDDWGLDKAELIKIKSLLQQAGANLNYSHLRGDIARIYSSGNRFGK